jgi:hypothetical protein
MAAAVGRAPSLKTFGKIRGPRAGDVDATKTSATHSRQDPSINRLKREINKTEVRIDETKDIHHVHPPHRTVTVNLALPHDEL